VPDTYSTIIECPSLHSVVLCTSMANRQGVQEMIRGHEATIYFVQDREDNELQSSEGRSRIDLGLQIYILDWDRNLEDRCES